MFPPNYATSRQLFRAAAESKGWTLHAHAVPGKGPEGEELTIDAAISPNPSARKVIIVSSGLHGVEGSFGAAVQLAALDEWTNRDDVRLVFLHALNPHGYAWGRRVDAENIDPNRNFLLIGDEHKGSPLGYKDFDALLNPPRPPKRWDFWTLRAWWALFCHGLPELKEALVVGQFDFPKGLFFGGHGPSATQIALRERMREWIGSADAVLHLDYHTGLGRYGTYKLLLDDVTLTKELRRKLSRWFGHGTFEQDDSNGVAYQPRGSFGPWCVAQDFAPDYLYLVAEFGTFGSVAMLGGMRAENQAHHWGDRHGELETECRARLQEVFCPADPKWRTKVLAGGVDLVRKAVAGIGQANPD